MAVLAEIAENDPELPHQYPYKSPFYPPAPPETPLKPR